MPYDGQVGTAKDGTTVVWVEKLGKAIPVTAAKGLGVEPNMEGPGGAGYDNVTSTKKYRDVLAAERAKDDIKRLQEASQGQRDAAGMRSTAARGEALLDDDTPVGPMADFRIGMGRALGGTPLSILPGIPNREQTSNLETFRTVGSEGALGDVSKLKGPLSEKELAFIQRMQADANATPEYNRRVLAAQKWAADRQSAYGAAMRAWTTQLGSPSALNARGESFDGWWGKYSSEKLPMPGISAPKTKPGAKASYRIVAVE